MAKISRLAGSTSNILTVYIQDSSSTTGAGLTGLAFGTSGLTCYYKRNTGTAAVAVTLVTVTTFGTYASGGFREIDATNLPGFYEFHPPDTAYASGAKSVAFLMKGAAGMAPTPVEIELTAVDNQDAVRGGITALPNAAVTANASLLTSGTGTDQLSVSAGKVLLQATQTGVTIPTVTTVTNQLTAAQVATGVWQDATAGDFTTAGSIGKSLFTSGAAPGAAGGLFVAGTNAATTVTTAFTTTFTGNLTGSVGSVTGNVGGTVTLAAATHTGAVIPTVTTVGTLTTYTGNTPQTGDAYAVVNSSTFGNAKLVRSTTPANTLDVSATGEAGIDWANVGGPTTAVGLSGTTVGTVTTATTATNLTNAPGSGDFTAAMKASLNAATPASVVGAVGSVTGAVGSVTGNVGGNVTGTVGSLAAQAKADTENAVWNGLHSAHTTAGTFGLFVDAAISGVSTGGVSAGAIATAVWQDLLSGSDFSTVGSVGKLLKDDIDAAVSTRLATADYTAPAATVTLATSQPNYAPAKAGDAMALTSAYDPAKAAAQATNLATLTATVGAAGAGLTALAPASTALSTGVWTGTKAGFLDAAISGVSTGGTSASSIATAVWQDLLSGSDFSTVGSVGKLLKDDVNAPIGSVGGGTAPTVAQIRAEMDSNSTKLANLDVILSTRLATSGYTAPPGTGPITTAVVAGMAGAPVGSVAGPVASVTAPVSINLGQTGLSPRALDSVGDSSLTVGDGLVAAISGAAGKETVVNLNYVVKTPSTGTTIRTFTLDSAQNPTSRS